MTMTHNDATTCILRFKSVGDAWASLEITTHRISTSIGDGDTWSTEKYDYEPADALVALATYGQAVMRMLYPSMRLDIGGAIEMMEEPQTVAEAEAVGRYPSIRLDYCGEACREFPALFGEDPEMLVTRFHHLVGFWQATDDRDEADEVMPEVA
jgi:hypothetical protein